MKTEKITINKTAEKPEGVQLDLVVPENPLETKLVSFLMASFLRELKQNNSFPYDLPADFKVDYSREGTFVVSGTVGSTQFYEPPKPIAIFGILPAAGTRFDLIHAAIPAAAVQQQAAAPAVAPGESPAPGEGPAAEQA